MTYAREFSVSHSRGNSGSNLVILTFLASLHEEVSWWVEALLIHMQGVCISKKVAQKWEETAVPCRKFQTIAGHNYYSPPAHPAGTGRNRCPLPLNLWGSNRLQPLLACGTPARCPPLSVQSIRSGSQSRVTPDGCSA
jgi:hypothetical protein